MKVIRCDSFFKRLRGLMFRKKLNADEAYLFKNCRFIHTAFMRFPIRVLGFNECWCLEEMKVVSPWQAYKQKSVIQHTVECAADLPQDKIVMLEMMLQKENRK